MADLDAELLALAGGDSSGEESVASSPPSKRKSPSPAPRGKQQRTSSPPDMARKGIAKTSKKPRRRKEYSESEDDASSPGQRSASVSMSQSESEADFGTAEDKPIYPYQKLYYDAIDKARIEDMNEIEREKVLAERSEQVERQEQDLALRRLVAARAKEAVKSDARNKRKASAADLEDSSQRKSSRQRTKLGGGRAGEASSAIEAYKQHRAERSQREEERRKKAEQRKEHSREDEYSEADAEAESDDEFDDKKYKRRTPTPPRDDPVAELADVQRARVGRENFAQVCYTPGFEGAITDCFARICIGPSAKAPGQNDYRICQIKGFTKGKPYAMQAPNGRMFPIDQYVIAAHGKAQKPWSFLECSMSKFTDDEWRRWRLTMANENCKMPTKGFVAAKLDQINKLLVHRFTEADISQKMKKQKELFAQINRSDEKEALKNKIIAASQAGNDDLIQELEEQLARIVPMKLAYNTSLGGTNSEHVNEEQERIAALNRKNLKITSENIRKAQLAELKSRKMKRTLAVPGVDELFDSDISRSGTPVNGHSTPNKPGAVSRSGTPNPGLTPLASNGTPRAGTPANGTKLLATEKKKSIIPTIRKSAMDDEIIKANLDLDIDIEI